MGISNGLLQGPSGCVLREQLLQDNWISGHLGRGIAIGPMALHSTLEGWVGSFLAHFFGSLPEGCNWDQSVFDLCYGDFEEFFYTNTARLKILTPIANMATDGCSISLDDGVSIRSLLREEQEEWLSARANSGGQWGLMADGIPGCAVERSENVQKVIASEGTSPALDAIRSDYLDDIRAALRLHKDGEVFFLRTGRRWVTHRLCSYGDSTWLGTEHSHPRFAKEYQLKASDAEPIKKLYSRLRTARASIVLPHVNLALRRFGYGCERAFPEDRLLDFMIGLEALFLRETDELSLRLAQRCAIHVSEEPAQRKLIFASMRRAYAMRSKVAHGKGLRKEVLTDDIVDEVEAYLRTALRTILLGPGAMRSQREFIGMLDEQVFG